MTTAIDVTQGDKGFDIVVSLTDASGVAVDLSGATEVKMKIVDADTNRNFVNAVAVIDGSPTLGKVKYTVQEDDFKLDGSYKGVVSVSFGATKTITSKSFFITVEKSFGK